jgi:Protein of unknown function (DUF4242)
MRVFLAEGYLPSATAEQLAAGAARAMRAAGDLSRGGAQVAYLRSFFLPSDQTCLALFEALSSEHVWQACRRAGIPCDRVTEALLAGPAAPAPPLSPSKE